MPLWAYAYEFMQPQPVDRMGAIQGLLDREEAEARKDARSWGSRFVTEKQVTHILIVSDSPRRDQVANRRLEADLGELKVDFFITEPTAIGDEAEEPMPPPAGAAGSLSQAMVSDSAGAREGD